MGQSIGVQDALMSKSAASFHDIASQLEGVRRAIDTGAQGLQAGFVGDAKKALDTAVGNYDQAAQKLQNQLTQIAENLGATSKKATSADTEQAQALSKAADMGI